MPRTACLTFDELTAFSTGGCDDTTADEIAGHLEACARCEARARDLDTQADDLLVRLRQGAAAVEALGGALARRIGEYDLLGEIGRGGMGVVYRARHERLGRTVAIKVLLAGPYANAALRDRFLVEARAAAQLQHPHVVQIFEIGNLPATETTPTCPYLVLEWVEGGSLADRLARQPIEPRLAARWLATLARAVAAAHAEGIVHRDIKPSNVLLTADDSPKLCDFGVAKILAEDAERTATGDLVGSAEYMAPEQAAGGKVGPPADIYALGAVLYAMLTGRPPFQGATIVDTLAQVQAQQPVSPRRLQPRVPRDLDVIALKCLEKDARLRYPTAEALAEDLERHLRGEAIAARPAGAVERLVRWSRRRPREALALSAIAALVLASATLGLVQLRDRAQQSQQATRAAEAALQEAVGLAGEARGSSQSVLLWRQALAAARRAEQAVAGGQVGADAQARVREALASIEKAAQEAEQLARQQARDQAMRQSLDDIRIGQAALGQSGFSFAAADADYAAAFREYGIDVGALPPAGAAALVRTSAIQAELVAALDNWAVSIGHTQPRQKLVEIADLADDDPWRRQLRSALLARDGRPLRALAADPVLAQQPPGSLERLSLALLSIGAWQEAIDVIRPARERFPDDFWINHQLAYLYYRATPPQYPAAIRYFTAATALRPQSAGAWFNLGIVLQYHGDLDEAAQVFERTLAMTPDYAPAHYGIGCILADRGQHDAALARFERAIALRPQYPEAEYSTGHVWFMRGEPKKAIEPLQRAIAQRPQFAVAHMLLGNAWQSVKRLEEAEISFRRAIAFNPEMAEAHCNLGHVLSIKGRPAEALVFLRRGHELGQQQKGWRYPSAKWCDECRRLVAARQEQHAARKAD